MAGRGLAHEAITALLRWLFETHPEVNRIEARVRSSDASGVRLLEKLHFVREGVIRHERSGTDGALLYGLLRSEWTG
jgi:ribosomal-protein-alanine N-acetyltransferase